MSESVNALNENIQQIIGVASHIIDTRGYHFYFEMQRSFQEQDLSKSNLLTKFHYN